MFNIYYLNFNKMYEISMLLDNEVTGKRTKEVTEAEERLRQFNASYNNGMANINPMAKDSNTKSTKIIEEIDIKYTKSVYLRSIYKKCKVLDNLTEVKTGSLIKIKNVKLNIDHDENMQVVNMISKGIFKDMEVDGYNIDNIVNPLIKDYSYLIKGSLKNLDEEIIIKVPMLSGNEFENLYSIYDILIGEVTVIGIYKGKVKYEEIQSTLNYMIDYSKENKENKNSINNSVIDTSSYTSKSISNIVEDVPCSSDKKYHYIDLIAITQDVILEESNITGQKKKSLLQKIKSLFVRSNHNEENIYI